MEDRPEVAPHVAEPSLSLRLQCADLDLDLAMVWPVKSSEPVQFEKVLGALASLGLFGSGYDLTKEAELERFGHATQRKDAQRKEQHEFYLQVAHRYASMSETVQTMKRDYYRELDHLRQQLSKQKRDPSFEADEVYFFDPAAYKLPAWEDVLDQLDGMRMKRELLLQQLGGERIRRVPMHMLCQKCRSKFQAAPREDDLALLHDRGTQTLPPEEVEDVCVQTDWRVVLRPNPYGQPVLEVEALGSGAPGTKLPTAGAPAVGLPGCRLPGGALPVSELPSGQLSADGEHVQSAGAAAAGRAIECTTSASAVHTLPDSQGSVLLLDESAEHDNAHTLGKALVQKQSGLQHAPLESDMPEPPEVQQDVDPRAQAAQALLLDGKAGEEGGEVEVQEAQNAFRKLRETTDALDNTRSRIPEVCHIAVQTDDEAVHTAGSTSSLGRTPPAPQHAGPVDHLDAGTRGRQPKTGEGRSSEPRQDLSRSSELRINHTASDSSLQREHKEGDSGRIQKQRRPLSAVVISEHAERMGDALQRVFSADPQKLQRRSFSLWKRRKMGRKEVAALRLQRQMLALQKHRERQALSRLKRASDVEKARDAAPEDAASTTKPLGVPVRPSLLEPNMDVRCSNGTLAFTGEDVHCHERKMLRSQGLTSRAAESLEEVEWDSKSHLSTPPQKRDRRPASGSRRPTSSGRSGRRPASSGGELSGAPRVSPREDSTATDPGISGRGLAQIQLGLQTDSLKQEQRKYTKQRQPHLEPMKELPHKLASRPGISSRQSSPKPPARSSPDPPMDRRRHSWASTKGMIQSASLGSVSLPLISNPHTDDDRPMRRSGAEFRPSVMRVSSATRP